MSKLVESPPPSAADKPSVGGRGSPRGRVLAAAAALLVAAAGVGFAVVAFGTGERTRPAATAANGKIAFATGVDGQWQIVTANDRARGREGCGHHASGRGSRPLGLAEAAPGGTNPDGEPAVVRSFRRPQRLP